MHQAIQDKGMNAKIILALSSRSPALLGGEHVRRPPSLLEAKSCSMIKRHTCLLPKTLSHPGSKGEMKTKGR